MKKNKLVCISCGDKFKPFGKLGDAVIFKCPNCGLGLTGNSGDFEQYHAYHRDPVYIKEEKQFSNIFLKRVGIILKFKSNGKALEVGSSTGLLLSLLRDKGWDVLGIEPSGTASGSARNRGIPTLTTTFELVQLPKQSFDLIIFNHVLEHLRDPIAALKKTKRLLKKDGLILIDVPNFGGLVARLKGVFWEYLAPKEHLWHFTKDSLLIILEREGFQIIYNQTHSGILDYGNPGKELWKSFIGGKKRFIRNLLTAVPSFLVTILNLGSGLTIVAKK